MGKCEELISEHLDAVVERMNTSTMLPFIGKKEVLMMFASFTDAVAKSYRESLEEDNEKLLSRLAELDKLYEEREAERKQTLESVVEEIKSEMVKRARIAFCQGVCKYSSDLRDTTMCYCARRQRFLNSLGEGLDKYIKSSIESKITKYNKVSWTEK